jgi:hypothetical protein
VTCKSRPKRTTNERRDHPPSGPQGHRGAGHVFRSPVTSCSLSFSRSWPTSRKPRRLDQKEKHYGSHLKPDWNLAEGSRLVYKDSWNRRVKKGNPGLYTSLVSGLMCRDLRSRNPAQNATR